MSFLAYSNKRAKETTTETHNQAESIVHVSFTLSPYTLTSLTACFSETTPSEDPPNNINREPKPNHKNTRRNHSSK